MSKLVLVLLGDASVGKTSLVLRFINNTIGAPVRLMIWEVRRKIKEIKEEFKLKFGNMQNDLEA